MRECLPDSECFPGSHWLTPSLSRAAATLTPGDTEPKVIAREGCSRAVPAHAQTVLHTCIFVEQMQEAHAWLLA